MSASLNETIFSGMATDFERKAWIRSPVFGTAEQVLIFLDAELYIDRVEAPLILKQLQDERRLRPTLAVYISHNGAAARHTDYTCNTDFAAFIANDVSGQIHERYPDVAQANTSLVGLSLSGLQAAFIARQYPKRFQTAICQSPSFWWENERFRQQIPPCPIQGPRYWICVGDQETEKDVSHPPSGMRQESTQQDACERTIYELRAQGYTVHSRVYSGGHDPACWRDDLILALTHKVLWSP